MTFRVAVSGALLAASLLSAPGPAQAAPVPSVGGYIEINAQGCRDADGPAPCFQGTDEAPYGAYQTLTFPWGSYTLYAGASVNANALQADIDGTELGGRITASFIDVYTLHGPLGGSLSFEATLDVTGQRSSKANTAVGFGTSRSTFIAGSRLHYFGEGHPTEIDEMLTLQLTDIMVGSTFSFATIVDLLVNSGETAYFGSTAVLGFTLPEGYHVSSQYGFSGEGSLQPDPNGVPAPGGLALVAAALAAGWAVRTSGAAGVRRRSRLVDASNAGSAASGDRAVGRQGL